MYNIGNKESGMDYTLPNSSGSGASGAYQFMQGTWDSYAEKVAPEYVGVAPMNAPAEVQDAVMYEKTSEMYDRYGGNIQLMALEHYGGMGAADEAMRTGHIPENAEWCNGDEYPSQASYAREIAESMGQAVPTFGGMANAVANSGVHTTGNPAFNVILDESPLEIARMNDRPFWDKLEDSFKNMWYENGTIAAMRVGLTKMNANPYYSTWKASDEDIKLLDEVLGDNKVAKDSVLLNAENPEQFKALLKMKKEDIEREKRAEQTSFGLHSVIGGALGMLLDPLNLIPFVGEEAFLVKVGARLGSKALVSLGSKRIMKIAESAAVQGALNMADSGLAERYGIHEANYAVAGVLGTAGGAGVRFLRTMRELKVPMNGEHMQRFLYQSERMQDQAVQGALDIADKRAMQTHSLLNTTEASIEKRLDDFLGGTPTLSKKESKALGKSLGKLLPEEDVEKVVGKKASKLLRDAGLSGDATVTDLLQKAGSIPSLGAKVRKAIEKYRKTPMSDSTWNAYLTSKGANPEAGVNRVKLAEEALQDDKKASALQDWIKKTKGEDVPIDDLRVGLKQILYRESGVGYTKNEDALIINGTVVRENSPVYDAIVHPEIYDPVSVPMSMPRREERVASERYVPPKKDKQPTVSKAEQEAFTSDVEMGSKTLREVEDENQRGFKSRIMKYIGRKMEDSKYLGDTYGHFTNSVSNHLRDFGHKMLGDPRQSAERHAQGLSLDFSTRKSVMQRQLREYIGGMRQCYRDYFAQHAGMPSKVRRQFGREFLQAYDQKVKYGRSIEGFQKEIQEAVRQAENFRKMEQEFLRRTGALTKDIPDTGFYRRAGVDKVAEFLTNFDSEQDAIDWLANYASKNANRDALERMRVIEEPDMELSEYVDREARNWAFGIIDRNLSNAKVTMRDLNHMDKLEQYQRRFPMDTSALSDKTMPNGEYFSFDECLRDYDVFSTMEQVANRSSAKATMASLGVKDMGAFFDGYRDKIERELRKANETRRLIKHSDVSDALEEFDYVVSQLTGYRYGTKRSQDPMNGVVRLLTKMSYAMNGYNMGLNQIGENFGMMSVTGMRAIGNMIPGLDKILHRMRTTTLSHDELKKLRIAADYSQYNFLNPMDLSTPKYDRIGLRAKVMGKLNTAVDYASDITSMLNQLSAWTERAVSMGEADVMSDLIDWAVLGRKGHLFNENAFKNVGVRDTGKFKDTINKYFGNLDHNDPDAVFKAIQKMQEEDYTSYVSMRAFTAQAVQRGIIQPNLSNANYFTKTGLFPMLLQFKNFSRMAINSHLARALERPDKEAMTQLLSSAIAGAGIWALRTQVYANWKYKDEAERKKFLDDTLTPDNFARAGITRSSLLAGLSFGNDLYEAVSGAPTVRTTVNRQGGSSQGLGSYIDQLPAVASLNTVKDGVGSAWSALNDLVVDNRVYQDDSKTIANMFPLDKFIGTQAVLSGLLDMHKGQISQDSFSKRPETKPSRNPIQMLQKVVTGTNDVEEAKEKQKETQKVHNKKKKQEQRKYLNMSGGKW